MIKFKLLNKDAKPPMRDGSDKGNAGIDIFTCFTGGESPIRITKKGSARITEGHSVYLKPGERAILPTGIACAVPKNMYLRIADRGGNASKLGMHVLAGVVDSNYRGEIKIPIVNLGVENIEIKDGGKVAQMIPTMISNDDIEIVENLDKTTRDKKGGVNEVK